MQCDFSVNFLITKNYSAILKHFTKHDLVWCNRLLLLNIKLLIIFIDKNKIVNVYHYEKLIIGATCEHSANVSLAIDL